MKKTNILKSLFSLLTVLIVVAAIICLSACGSTEKKDGDDAETRAEEITITVKVKGSDGNVTDFVIKTRSLYLRGALEQENLVEGDESEYGLYVKIVNGEQADYDTDKAYWSFYKDEDYLMSGIDTTPISDGDVFRIEYTVG